MERDEMEMQIWEFIDGACSAADHGRIAGLVENDAAWAEKYRELAAVHANIFKGLELEQPSMRFSKNVMDVVEKTAIAPPAGRYVNRALIRGIAALLVGMVAILLVYAIAVTNWKPVRGYKSIGFDFHSLSSALQEMHLWNIVIAINAGLALLLADSLLRRRKSLM